MLKNQGTIIIKQNNDIKKEGEFELIPDKKNEQEKEELLVERPEEEKKFQEKGEKKEEKKTNSSKKKEGEEGEKKDPVEEGHTEAIKEGVKEKDKSNEKLQDIMDKSGIILFRTASKFPFDLFPDKLVIDINKVTVITASFFLSARVHSIFIQNISDVFVETGPIFATLKIIDSGFVENSVDVRYLKKDDALKARRIIQGIIVAKKQEINLSQLSTPNLAEKLEELGTVKEPSE